MNENAKPPIEDMPPEEGDDPTTDEQDEQAGQEFENDVIGADEARDDDTIDDAEHDRVT